MLRSQRITKTLAEDSCLREALARGARIKAVRGEEEVCDFSLGNPDLEPPEALRRVLHEEIARPSGGLHRYTPHAGSRAVRERVAAHVAREHRIPVSADHVVMTVGAAGGLNALLKAILDPGDEVVQLSPFFPDYGRYVENHAGVVRTARTTPTFDLDPEAVAASLGPRSRAVIINSPNNPTGRVYREAGLRMLGEILSAHERKIGRPILLIADDPYSSLTFDGLTVPSPFGAHRHVVLVRTHSKDLAIPGERIGFAVVHPGSEGAVDLAEAIAYANRILGFVNAPALMQRVVASLQGASVGRDVYQRRRDYLLSRLSAAGYRCVRPDGAFYLFPAVPAGNDIAFAEVLARHGVLVLPGTAFGCPGYFRIAYSVADEVIERSIPHFVSARDEAVSTGV